MGAERIDGIKYHLDRETDEAVLGIYENLKERRDRLDGDIEHVAGHLVTRGLLDIEELIPEAPAQVDGQLPIEGLENPFRVDL